MTILRFANTCADGRARLLLALALCAPFGLHAAQPASGTLSGTNRNISYTSGPFAVSNPSSNETGGTCASEQSCDHFDLTVDFSGVSAADQVTITTSWNGVGEDFDVYLMDAAGAVVKSSASANQPEVMVAQVSELTASSYRIRIIPYLAAGGTTTTVIQLGPPADPCAQSGTPNQGTANLSPTVARDLDQLPAFADYGAFVHFSMGTSAEHRQLLGAKGLTVTHDFENRASSVFAVGSVSAFRELVGESSVSYIEENRKLRYLGETATWASRARVAQEAVSGGPYRDGEGRLLTGEGVTVVVIDTGVNAPHPDFQGRVVHNYKIVGSDLGVTSINDVGAGVSSDTTGGHGTHVAGIALGSGQASNGGYPMPEAAPIMKGTFTGVAPGASLVAYGAGEGLSILTSTAALQHILDHYDEVTPRIRIVSNSYGADGGLPYNPADTFSCLTRALVDKGVSMVFAASNDGGNGYEDLTSPTCKDPTPGVVCVANYDDGGSGALHNGLDSTSSRGKRGEPTTYPDIAAPGANYTATCAQAQPGQSVCANGETRWQPYYGTISGTSMATPHVSGTLALLYQARPDLTPAQAEKVLQDTARKVVFNGLYDADPQNPGGTINFGVGAGLLNVPAALDALGVAHAGPVAPGLQRTVIDGDSDPALEGAGDVVKLTMQESASGPEGIAYELTLRDATDVSFSNLLGEVSLSLEQNVNGQPFVTRMVLGFDGNVTVPEEGVDNTAVATGVSRAGNIIRFFLAYDRLGYPPAGAPIHNIRVLSVGEGKDFAPSPISPSTDAELEPMFGRAFTVQRAGASAPLPDACGLPGVRLAADAAGDAQNQQPAYDIQSLHAAEPPSLPGKIVFTMKVGDLATLPPNTLWAVRFNAPHRAPNGHDAYFVGLSSVGGIARFVHGTSYIESAAVTSVTIYEIAGDIDAANSGYTPEGLITLAADLSLFEVVTGDLLNNFLGTTRPVSQDAGPIGGGSLDTAEGGYYIVRAGGPCGGGLPGSVPGAAAVPTSVANNNVGALDYWLWALALMSLLGRWNFGRRVRRRPRPE